MSAPRRGCQAGSLVHPLFEGNALFEQRRQGQRHQAGRLIVGRQAAGAHRLGGDVVAHHEAGVHRDEIDLAHVGVQPDHRLVDQAALVVVQQVEGGLLLLRLLLVPGDEDAVGQGGHDLHGGDAGAGRGAGRGLHRQAGDAGRLQHALQGVIIPQDGVVAVDVPAAEQVDLLRRGR